jgi:glycosyltransferase involved in cell wall biosynthesis
MRFCGRVDVPHKLNVGLCAHLMSLGRDYRSAGATWYIYNTLCHLPAAAPELRYTAFLNEPRFSPPQGMRVQRSSWPTATPYGRIAWEQLRAPVALRQEQIDVLHGMAFVVPLLSPCPTVVTVLDLSFLRFPEAFKGFKRAYLTLMTRLSVRRAAKVIAISESTRQDVIELLGVPPERVVRIYCGTDPRFRPLPADEVAAFRQEKGLPSRFVLFLGTIEPRKNAVTLIEAFAALIAAERRQTEDLQLVLAGGRGWLAEPVYARVEELGLQDRVRFAGYVPESEKTLWYNAATCFCYPSLYEGFGLPPLEAMACGVPVVTSNVSSLPEVVGEAALTVDPLDSAALCEALRHVLVDRVLRIELSALGPARARLFSWSEAARQTADVYRRVYRWVGEGAG